MTVSDVLQQISNRQLAAVTHIAVLNRFGNIINENCSVFCGSPSLPDDILNLPVVLLSENCYAYQFVNYSDPVFRQVFVPLLTSSQLGLDFISDLDLNDRILFIEVF